MAAENGGVGSQTCALAHESLAILVLTCDMTARVDDISKYYGGATENIIFQFNARINGNIILDLHVVSQTTLRGDNHVLPDVAVPANCAPGHNVREMPNIRTFSDLAWLINGSRWMDCVRAPSPRN